MGKRLSLPCAVDGPQVDPRSFSGMNLSLRQLACVFGRVIEGIEDSQREPGHFRLHGALKDLAAAADGLKRIC